LSAKRREWQARNSIIIGPVIRGGAVRQKDQADELAGQRSLGSRISYHRTYRIPPLGCFPFFVLFAVLCVSWFQLVLGWWSTILLAAMIVAIAAYVRWPARVGIRGVGVYDDGLVLLAAPRAVALPWAAISRVVYMKGESRTTYSGPSRTTHVQYAFTQLWLRGEAAPVALAHIRRHKLLVRFIQAGIGR
jgi:hypothetical protein